MAPESDDHRGIERAFLAVEVAGARGGFRRLRITIAWRATFHDVRDEDILTRPADGVEQLVEELSRRADERAARGIFTGSGPFSHQ